MQGVHGVQRGSVLLDLDDALLAKVLCFLDPFPTVASAALTCRRFHRLATDKGRWLIVSPTAVDAAGTPSGRAGPTFRTLAAAVAASRPGDTIWLAPRVRHEASNVRLQWPLHICGAGAGSTTLASPSGEAAIPVTASAKVIGLSIESRLGPCIMHSRGTLRVESCTLRCLNGGLDHILAPIITAAVSGPPSDSQAGLQPEQHVHGQRKDREDQPRLGAAPAPQPAGGADPRGCGRLAVADTRLEGTSGCGVLCTGTGAVRSVRVVHGAAAAWYFLEVDSSFPGKFPAGARPMLAPPLAATEPPSASHRLTMLKGHACKPTADGPAAAPYSGDRVQFLEQREQSLHGLRQQQDQPGSAALKDGEEHDQRGLSRINCLLGRHAISPSLLSAHLAAQARAQGRE